MNPFSPQYVPFILSLATGILFMIVTAAGGVGDGHDADADHDVDHDADHDHEDALVGRALSALGVGRAPLMLTLTVFLMLFGAIGFGLNLILSRWLPALIYGWVSLALSCASSVALTGRVARLFSRLMPKTESYSTTNEDLCGCVGTALYAVTEAEGMVQVRDRRGAVQKVAARTSGGERVPTGADVVVVSYREDGDCFLVTRGS